MIRFTAEQYKALSRFKHKQSNKKPPYPRLEQKKTKIVAISPLEDDECKALVFYLDILMEEGKIVQYTHVASETYTKSWKQKTRNRLMGVRRGFPDYVIVTPLKVIYIEMKRLKGGTVSPEQKLWLEALQTTGAVAKVCNGFEEAKALILQHIP